MNTTIRFVALAALFAATVTAQTTTPPVTAPPVTPHDTASCLDVTTVENFNVTRYAEAPWYVQKQAVNAYTPSTQTRCVTAQYEFRDDDNTNWWEKSWWGYTINVFNYAENAAGASQSGGLCADFDEDTPSQLGVAPCFLPQWFAGPYWIVSYREGAEDGYALVSGGQPENVIEGETDCGAGGTEPCCKTGDGINNSGLWILTRQRNPSAALVTEVSGIAKELGFSTSVLFTVTHDEDCQVPGIDDVDEDEDEDESTRARVLRGTHSI